MKLTKLSQRWRTSKKYIAVVLAAPLLAFSVVGFAPQKVHANPPPAYIICAATRPGWVMALEELILYNVSSAWTYMDPQGQFLKTTCAARSRHWDCTWHAILWANGSYNGYAYDCYHHN